MRAKSIAVQNVDPYKAGVELGDQLKSIQPEIVITFPSVDFAPFDSFIEGLKDGLEDDSVIIVGGTGDGFYETKMVGEIGASALAINSNGKIKYHTLMLPINFDNAETQAFAAMKELEARMVQDKNKLVLCFSDYRTNGTALASGLQYSDSIPVVGGFLGNSKTEIDCYSLFHGEVYQNQAIFIAMEGDFDFSITTGSGWESIGQTGTVTLSQNHILKEIDGISATNFIEKQTGMKSSEILERGNITIEVFSSSSDIGEGHCMRAIESIDSEAGALNLFGGVKNGDRIKVAMGNIDSVSKEVSTIAKKSYRKIKTPRASIVISCACRKWLLGEQITKEVDYIFHEFNDGFPMVGFPSFGEFAPVLEKDHKYKNSFHNVTFVLLSLSEKLDQL